MVDIAKAIHETFEHVPGYQGVVDGDTVIVNGERYKLDVSPVVPREFPNGVARTSAEEAVDAKMLVIARRMAHEDRSPYAIVDVFRRCLQVRVGDGHPYWVDGDNSPVGSFHQRVLEQFDAENPKTPTWATLIEEARAAERVRQAQS